MPETVREVLYVAASVGSTAVLVSFCVYLCLAHKGDNQTLLATMSGGNLSWKEKAFLLAAGLAVLVCAYTGAKTMLFWVPSNWGGVDEDGNFQPLRDSLATMFALFGGFSLIKLLDAYSHDHFLLRLTRDRLRNERRVYEAKTLSELERLKDEFEAFCKPHRESAARKGKPMYNTILFPEAYLLIEYDQLLQLIEQRKAGMVSS